MKILYLTSNGGIHDYRFLKKLAGDYEVLLLHYSSSNLIEEIQDIKGLKIISKRSVVRSFPLLSEYFHFKKCVADFKPGLIHSGYVWQVGILPALLDFHPHLSMPWGSDILTEPGRHFLLKALTRKTMRQCGHIQCDAEFVKQKIISDYKTPPEKITVFPWGIELGLFKPADKTGCRKKLNLDENAFVVIFNRALENVYGIENLLEGFREFSKDKKDVKLLLVSDGSKKDFVNAFIRSNDLEQKIEFVGRITNNELPLYLNASDVYLSTSLSDGTSLSLLEAMACGLGIVVTDLPAIREWINDENGIIAGVNNSGSVSAALEKYYENRKLIKIHGDKNLEIAKKRCNWDINYRHLKKIYDDLIVNSPIKRKSGV